MPPKYLSVLALALASAAPAFASETITRAQALDAIRAFEASAAGGIVASKSAEQANDAVASASNTIVKYSLESDDVVVDLGADSVPWFDARRDLSDVPHSGERGVLLVAYLSGAVRAQLQTGKQDPNPYPGWVAMLKMYHALKIREGVAIPEVEALVARQMDGTLESYAAAAVQRSRDGLRKAYGSSGVQPKQIVTASSQP
jgi:hypothetical protein